MNKRKLGKEWEEKVCTFLLEKGYFIVAVNFSCPCGEIDIIALKGSTLVFVEVKYRKTAQYGYAAEAVTSKKQAAIRKTAMHYLMVKNQSFDTECRFDVIGIDNGVITHIENAF